jgi:hypothetical protein
MDFERRLLNSRPAARAGRAGMTKGPIKRIRYQPVVAMARRQHHICVNCNFVNDGEFLWCSVLAREERLTLRAWLGAEADENAYGRFTPRLTDLACVGA